MGVVALLFAVLAFQSNAADPATNSPVPYLERVLEDTKTAHATHPERPDSAWQFARACFDRAEFASNNTHRAELAHLGIAAARAALTQNADSAAGHYYLGMNLGQLARTKSLGALRLVDEMEAEFKQARALDEQFDHAGPDRNLGRLYFQAPSIGSVGSRTKARSHFDRAAELAPDYPENRINLVEAALRWKEMDVARRELAVLELKLDDARTRFSGPEWIAAWLDWDARLEKVRHALRPPVNNPARAGKGGNLFD